MDAKPLAISAILKDPRRFVVPIYQRQYAWTEKGQLERFWGTIEEKANARLDGHRSDVPHYMGAVLLSPRGEMGFGLTVFDVVDGQQRLTTFQIFIAALRDVARERGAERLAEQLLVFITNADSSLMTDPKNERYKLDPTKPDRGLYRDLVDRKGDELREKYAQRFFKNGRVRKDAPRALQAWSYFRSEAADFVAAGEAPEPRLEALSTALLMDFRMMCITLDRTDNPQVIFETLNFGGEPLLAIDLVRNDVFHRAAAKGEDVERLLEESWAVLEDPFWKVDETRGRITKPRVEFLLANALAAEDGREVALSELYASYKAFVSTPHGPRFDSAEAEVKTLVKYAPTYRALVEESGGASLASLARQLHVFDVSTAYPVVLVIETSAASDEEKASLHRLISSYLVRRELCGLTGKAYNQTFVRWAAELRSVGVSVATFSKIVAKAADTVSTSFPSDETFRREIQQRNQYDGIAQRKLAYMLGELERASRDRFDETVDFRPDLTIEHVLPQKWAQYWPLQDGTVAPLDLSVPTDDARRESIARREAAKNTLGNLTLLTPAKNPRLSNFAFQDLDAGVGRSKQQALRESLLKMNQEIAANEQWSETEIAARAELLFRRAVRLWPYPSVSAS